jgi:hypothetical protein
MADELTVPLLPCASIDVMADFYEVLGFRTTYRQTRPNPYLAVAREDLHLHFFGMPDFVAADSYGSCLVLVPDVGALHAAFAERLRAAYGKVPVAGIPRMTRPRPKKNQDGVTGFSIVDPGGNWIRISARPAKESEPIAGKEPGAGPSPELGAGELEGLSPELGAGELEGLSPELGAGELAGPSTEREAGISGPRSGGRLGTTLENAVVLGDSRGDHRQAAKILDGALARPDAGDDPSTLVEALAYRAELAVALGDPATAHEVLARLRAVELTADARKRLAVTLQAAAELVQ